MEPVIDALHWVVDGLLSFVKAYPKISNVIGGLVVVGGIVAIVLTRK